MANQTMRKFGWPDSVIGETEHWIVQLRPQQPTLGALVLICKDEARAFGAIPPAAHADLATAVPAVERMLSDAIGYEKINYLMLMMVDPDVHFHVLPRYDGTKNHGGLSVEDVGWPGPPALSQFVEPGEAERTALRDHLRGHWAP